MDSQLRGTTLAKSFKRVGDSDTGMPADATGLATSAADITLDNFAAGAGDSDGASVDSDDDVGVGVAAGAAGAAGGGSGVGAGSGGEPKPASSASSQAGAGSGSESDDELAPVDVDFNLVSNLLASVHGQQGQSGPGSNVLGELGVAWRDVLEPGTGQ